MPAVNTPTKKIETATFTFLTGISFDRLRTVAGEAARRISRDDLRIHEDGVTPGKRIDYSIKRLNESTVGTFSLKYENDSPDAGNIVTLVPGGYSTIRARFLFVPMGPRDAVGYPVLKEFSDSIIWALRS